jgi:transcriptional regulator with XRE-family HTH domain
MPVEDERQQIRIRLGSAIRAARHRKGITQQELAHILSVSQRTISAMELGEVEVPLSEVTRLAQALDVDPVGLVLAAWPNDIQLQPDTTDIELLYTLKQIPPDKRDIALKLLRALSS